MSEKKSYQNLHVELEKVIETMESPHLSIEDATAAYKNGIKLINQLKLLLKNAKNEVKIIRNLREK